MIATIHEFSRACQADIAKVRDKRCAAGVLAISVMSEIDDQRAALKRFMMANGLNTHAWAKAAGVPDSTLRTYLEGRTQSLKSHVEVKLARAAGVSVDALYGRDYALPREMRTVWVKGFLGAGNAVVHFEVMGEREGYYEVNRPFGVDPLLEIDAMEVRGGSMPPYRDGDVIYYERRDGADLDAIIGEPCVVELAEGGMVFKEVRRGYEAGTVNLHSWDGSPPKENVRIRRAMPFVAGVRKRHARL